MTQATNTASDNVNRFRFILYGVLYRLRAGVGSSSDADNWFTGPALLSEWHTKMREIRIRELSVADARLRLDTQLNEAFMAGELRVEVLHGIGSGALRRMTRELIMECGFAKVVTDLVHENPGVTVVDLSPPSRQALRGYT